MELLKKSCHLSWLRFQNEYFIFLLPLFFIFHGFNEHYGKIPLASVFLLLLKYQVAILLLTGLFSVFLRSTRKAALLVFVYFFVNLFFGTVHDWLKASVSYAFFVSYRFVLSFLLVALTGLFIYLLKSKRSFSQLVRYLNILLLIITVAELGGTGLKKPAFAEIIQGVVANSTAAKSLTPCDTCQKEDIHLIVLDEYAGEKELEEIFHFDNSAFIRSLEKKGFHVVRQSRSNYNYTELSTASLLSMDYLANLKGKSDNELYHIGSSIIRDNIFTSYLQRLGYGINNFSIFDLGDRPALNPHFKPKISLITDRTLLPRLEKDIGFHLWYTLKLNFALNRLSRTIEKEAALPSFTMGQVVRTVQSKKGEGPQFYYTHLMLPHVPYYFDSEGRFTGLQQYLYPGNLEQSKKAYLEYLQYTNKKIIAFIDDILKAASRPTVIMVISDHGYRHPTVKKDHHFSTINAVYLPDKRYDGFYEGQSNVNQLRVLVNNRFDQKLPILYDSSIYLGRLIEPLP
jgi:hypothetical protein